MASVYRFENYPEVQEALERLMKDCDTIRTKQKVLNEIIVGYEKQQVLIKKLQKDVEHHKNRADEFERVLRRFQELQEGFNLMMKKLA